MRRGQVMVTALTVAVVAIGVWASAGVIDSDDAPETGSAKGGSDLATGVQIWGDMGRVEGLTLMAGEQLQASARDLSGETDVQEATLAVGWKATCAVVLGEVRLEPGAIAQAVLDLAPAHGISFLDDGEEVVAQAVQRMVNENANDAAEKCDELRNAGF
jgi:hypothetical protein